MISTRSPKGVILSERRSPQWKDARILSPIMLFEQAGILQAQIRHRTTSPAPNRIDVLVSVTRALNPHNVTATLAALSPNHAIILATIGICLIFFELNRPGRILPGALGLTLLLFATASLLHHPIQPAALLLLLLASATLAANLWRRLPSWLAIPISLAFALSLRFLVPNVAKPHISTPAALTCGLLIGLLGTALSRIALRARRLKAVH